MEVEAIYCFGADVRVPCTVRLHMKNQALGDVKGTAFQFAERIETTPKAIFLVADVRPARGGIIMVAASEAYAVDNVEPPDGITVTANITKVPPGDPTISTLPYPGMPTP